MIVDHGVQKISQQVPPTLGHYLQKSCSLGLCKFIFLCPSCYSYINPIVFFFCPLCKLGHCTETPGKESGTDWIAGTCYAMYLACMDTFINWKFQDNCFFVCSVFCFVQGMNNLFLASFTFVTTTAIAVSCNKLWNCILNIYHVIKGYKILSL